MQKVNCRVQSNSFFSAVHVFITFFTRSRSVGSYAGIQSDWLLLTLVSVQGFWGGNSLLNHKRDFLKIQMHDLARGGFQYKVTILVGAPDGSKNFLTVYHKSRFKVKAI